MYARGMTVRELRAHLTEMYAHVIPFYAFPPEVRQIIYATNAIESLQMHELNSSKSAQGGLDPRNTRHERDRFSYPPGKCTHGGVTI